MKKGLRMTFSTGETLTKTKGLKSISYVDFKALVQSPVKLPVTAFQYSESQKLCITGSYDPCQQFQTENIVNQDKDTFIRGNVNLFSCCQ